MNPEQNIPVDARMLLPQIDHLFIQLLKELSPEDWQRPTVARLWKVKDVVGHLLDGNIRALSMLRDGYFGESPSDTTYKGLVNYLNGLNADWVKAMKRVSPSMLIILHEITGPLYCNYYAGLDPFAPSPFAVSWAGDTESPNWKHIAREYTEKFLHQQQIRDAVNKPGLMNSTYYTPFIHIFMLALPHQFKEVNAPVDTVVKLTIPEDIGGSWQIIKRADAWEVYTGNDITPATTVSIPAAISWPLFSKSIRPDAIMEKINIEGNRILGEHALHMVAVMA
ncbi:maleylpyruvate isomerase N-terminal domain-containing protein [Terrimonas rubra]|uniref:Maleylpyruvate isomerase N-terminal domain-containing protein n=1 Tax=Terrimonas rubra TaxID=1035890 RepID=A0ABW6A541_9BACT